MWVTKVFLANVGGGAIRALRVRPNAFAANYPPDENRGHPRCILDGDWKVPRRLGVRICAPGLPMHQNVAGVDDDARLRNEGDVMRGYYPSPTKDGKPQREWRRRVLEGRSECCACEGGMDVQYGHHAKAGC